jgi:hypothetical protein
MALFVVTPVLGPVLSASASSVFSGPLVLTFLSLPLFDCLLVAAGVAPALPLLFSLALTSLPALALALVSLLAFASELPDALPLAFTCELALALVLDLAAADAFADGAGALAGLAAGAGAGAGALAGFDAGWLLEPPFALFLLPSPLPPICWSLVWLALSLL